MKYRLITSREAIVGIELGLPVWSPKLWPADEPIPEAWYEVELVGAGRPAESTLPEAEDLGKSAIQHQERDGRCEDSVTGPDPEDCR